MDEFRPAAYVIYLIKLMFLWLKTLFMKQNKATKASTSI